MGQRSRKRGQRDTRQPRAQTGAAGTPGARAAERATVKSGSRDERRPAADAPPARQPSRSELKDAAVRAQLRPLAPGERPSAVTVAAIVAAVLAVLVLVGYAVGAQVGGEGTLWGAILLSTVLLVAAWGMWNVRYWAVLGFEALLAFQVIVAALSLMVASNVWAAVLCIAAIVLGGWLFWKLIRAMARIQMPSRPPAP